jgi:hypothetical protein
MTDEDIEVVAEELAKRDGLSWYPGRRQGPLAPLVTDCYRDKPVRRLRPWIISGSVAPHFQSPALGGRDRRKPSIVAQSVMFDPVQQSFIPLQETNGRIHAGSWKPRVIAPTWFPPHSRR